MGGFPIPKTMNKESTEYKVAKSKYAKIIPISVVIGLITLKLLPIFISPPHHPEVFHSGPIKTELALAINRDDWTQVQTIYQKCKIDLDAYGNKSWLPLNCEPFIMIHDSITAKAQHVYHGLANESSYGLASSWQEREEEYFPKVIK